MKKTITVIGSSNVDMIMKMEKLPRLGETVTDAEFFQVYGGKGANTAVGAARAGGNVNFVNCVGDDIFSDPMVENFRKDGINTDFVFKERGISSGTALIMIGEKGDNYLSVAPGANYRLTSACIDKAVRVVKEADIILIQNEIPTETIKYLIDKAWSMGKKIMYNFAPAKPIFDIEWEKISYLVVNETEAEFLSGQKVESDDEMKNAAALLAGKGVSIVIITLGDRGSYVHSDDLTMLLPAFKVDAKDTTAAGDIYCGSLAVALTEGKSLKDAVSFAGAASAISVTRIGAQPSAPKRHEIDEFIKRYTIN
jgi:ribokinase